jgi:hypothetical protein
VDLPPAESTAVLQTLCYLRLKNDTDEKLTVYVQFRAWSDRGEWVWYPADPASSKMAYTYELKPGEEKDVTCHGRRVSASRIRMCAESASGHRWMDYRDQDLWLVPEDDDGDHSYEADEMETYTATFDK